MKNKESSNISSANSDLLMMNDCNKVTWENAKKNNIIQMCRGYDDTEPTLDLQCWQYCKYYEKPIYYFTNKMFVLITNLSIYYGDKNNISRIKLKTLEVESVDTIMKKLEKDRELVSLKERIENCIFWIKNIYDISVNGLWGSDIQYTCKIKQATQLSLFIDVRDELAEVYD